jgi:hypothetical protein
MLRKLARSVLILPVDDAARLPALSLRHMTGLRRADADAALHFLRAYRRTCAALFGFLPFGEASGHGRCPVAG